MKKDQNHPSQQPQVNRSTFNLMGSRWHQHVLHVATSEPGNFSRTQHERDSLGDTLPATSCHHGVLEVKCKLVNSMLVRVRECRKNSKTKTMNGKPLTNHWLVRDTKLWAQVLGPAFGRLWGIDFLSGKTQPNPTYIYILKYHIYIWFAHPKIAHTYSPNCFLAFFFH